MDKAPEFLDNSGLGEQERDAKNPAKKERDVTLFIPQTGSSQFRMVAGLLNEVLFFFFSLQCKIFIVRIRQLDSVWISPILLAISKAS